MNHDIGTILRKNREKSIHRTGGQDMAQTLYYNGTILTMEDRRPQGGKPC